ncbi:MAG: hypothetical protein H6822_00210 [Planctomycetaceae bacterium]|nr:hypothetical protein [Planctomycetales bacterium]MCB9920568.1 hypothetical protein [Planctomycetaceae bacterium]
MKDGAGFAFFVLLVLTVIVVVVVSQVRSQNDLKRTYQRIAQRFQGRCNIVGLRERPSINFVYRNAYALLDIYSTGGKHKTYYTQFRISWPDSHFRCEVYPEGILSRLAKFIGMADIEIGSPQFDADYVIHGVDAHQLRDFLAIDVQRTIDRLRALCGNYDIYISVGGGQLLIKKQGLIRDFDELESFVLLSVDLFDQASQASAEGIQFVEAQPEAKLSLKDAICQICGEAVKLDAVFCRTCKTPHHKDCWEYYGTCSTYGCGQRRYLVQKKN